MSILTSVQFPLFILSAHDFTIAEEKWLPSSIYSSVCGYSARTVLRDRFRTDDDLEISSNLVIVFINWSMIFRSLSCGPIVVCLIMKYISKIFSGIQVLIEEKNSNQSEICKMLFIRCASISWIYDVTNNVTDTK